MSNSQHPRALSVERWVSDSTRLLAVVLCLPLVDGVFVTLVLGGALDSLVGILEVGFLVFGGSAMVAVILAEMDGTPRRSVGTVLAIGVVVVPVAGLQAALAPTIESAIDMAVFERFAALVILAVAASTASAKIAEYLPSPALIIGLGFLATVSPSEATLTIQADLGLVARAMAAAGVGVGFGVVLAAARPWLQEVVELDRFRFGSAVALGVLAVSIAGMLPSEAPVALLVLGMTALLAFDPGGDTSEHAEAAFDVSLSEDESADVAGPTPISDGGGPPDDDTDATESTTGLRPGQDRPPWL